MSAPIVLDLSLNPRGVWELPRTGKCGHPTFERPDQPGTYRCPQCHSTSQASWKARNPERNAAHSAEWRARNPEKVMRSELNRVR